MSPSTAKPSHREKDLRVVDFGNEYGHPPATQTPRERAHHMMHHHRFCTNRISTAKYNWFTFLPKFLFIMFSRAAYFYFLVQMCLSWWPAVSPFGGIGFTMALLFVLFISGAKEVVEDVKRHQYDRLTNSTTAHIVHLRPTDASAEDASAMSADPRQHVEIRDEKWEDVRVGQIILVRDGEEIPADCVCLHTAVDGTCYVNTANLDGETNLKIKRAMRGAELSSAEAEQHSERPSIDEGNGDEVEPSPFSGRPISSNDRAKTMRDADAMQEQALKLALIKGKVSCEQPSAHLHNFKGFVSVEHNPWIEDAPSSASGSGPRYPLDMGEVMLRGTRLMNSGYAFGLVIYTGKETRIFMNNSQTPSKHSSMENFLGIQIVILAVVQIIMCILCGVGSYIWRDYMGFDSYYLQFDKFVAQNYENPVAYIAVYTVTFWILFSSMLPISLIVSLELVRFWQCIVFINFDPEMRVDNEDKTMWPKARNSNVNDDLARISYIFSDKTGTLTSNEMQLRQIAVGTNRLGRESFKFEDVAPADPASHVASDFDPSLLKCYNKISGLNQVVDYLELGTPVASSKDIGGGDGLPAQVLKFFTSMALCHSVLPEVEDRKLVGYQGPSPDEVCIVSTMKKLGWVFKENKANVVYMDILGKKCKFRILNVLEFSSDRKRMSVIVQDQRKRIYLISKGADTVMLPRTLYGEATNASTREEVDGIIHDYSCKGLRCLMFGAKEMSYEDWKSWNKSFRQAANDIENREDRMAECMEQVETDLHFLGITAVEDKLQEEVPESIEILRDAHIKVWVITGDKQETAINIGIACRLISDPEKLMVFNEESKGKLKSGINSELEKLVERKKQGEAGQNELVIDGKTLAVVLSDPDVSKEFARLGSLCDCVLVCRASPSQKAAIVTLMKDFERTKLIESKPWGLQWTGILQNWTSNRVLSIGDGANDVPMIQRADVGVGIVGKEGRQASNNSDFSIARFRFLVRLLLVHGQTTQYRNANLIKYSFYKNIAISMMFFYYQFYCGYSGQPSVDQLTLQFYNTVFTAIPILIFALLDSPVESLETLMRYPKIYNRSNCLTTGIFWKTQIKAFWDGAICFFIPYYAAFFSGADSVDGLYAMGRIAYIALQFVVTLEVLMISRHITVLFIAFVLYSCGIVFPFFYLFEWSMQIFKVPDPGQSGVTTQTFQSAAAWLQMICVIALSVGVRFIEKGMKTIFYPDDVQILSEGEVSKLKAARIRKHVLNSQGSPIKIKCIQP